MVGGTAKPINPCQLGVRYIGFRIGRAPQPSDPHQLRPIFAGRGLQNGTDYWDAKARKKKLGKLVRGMPPSRDRLSVVAPSTKEYFSSPLSPPMEVSIDISRIAQPPPPWPNLRSSHGRPAPALRRLTSSQNALLALSLIHI